MLTLILKLTFVSNFDPSLSCDPIIKYPVMQSVLSLLQNSFLNP